MIRIIGGEFRSRQLIEPRANESSRPYQAVAREAVFNLLRGWIEGVRILDLFAGIGSMGLEAVSRGAAEVLLVEKDHRTYQHLKDNIEMLGCGDRAKPMLGDALATTALLRAPQPIDIVFIDPPFRMMEDDTGRQRVFAQLQRAVPYLSKDAWIVLRSPMSADEVDLSIPGFVGPEAHEYGKINHVLLYQPALETDRHEERAHEAPSHHEHDSATSSNDNLHPDASR